MTSDKEQCTEWKLPPIDASDGEKIKSKSKSTKVIIEKMYLNAHLPLITVYGLKCFRSIQF